MSTQAATKTNIARRKPNALTALCLLVLLAATTVAWEKDKPAKPPVIPPNPNHLPQVLLVGDSISAGYHQLVAKALEGRAVVARSADNGESTAVGVLKIDGWLGDAKWDVIHFNWGVWDMYGWQYAADDRSPAKYAERLETLVLRMKRTGAKLIWATTTPVPPNAEAIMLERWKKAVVIDENLERQYQDAALQVMKKHGVAVNDLFALMKPRRSEFQADDNVHFSPAGSALLAKQVASAILQQLDSAKPASPQSGPKSTSAASAGDQAVKEMQDDFLKLKFGMFIHFNMATFNNRQWATGHENPASFAPARLDCGQWADAAKAAGMKYAVFTVKHTGGWCLWASQYTTHDITACTNYHQGNGDLVREYVDAFRARGLKVGLYYCMPGDFSSRKDNKLKPGQVDLHGLPPEAAGDYVGFIKKQLTELLTRYGQVDVMWFDQYSNKYTGKDWRQIKAHVKSLQPGCVVIANNSLDFKDTDIHSYEHPWLQANKRDPLPPEGNLNAAEVCDTLGLSWFWTPRENEGAMKSVEDVTSMLELCRKRRANYLLNVGPDMTGRLPDYAVKRLREIGARLGVLQPKGDKP
jgi:alpha-L-fucosidase